MADPRDPGGEKSTDPSNADASAVDARLAKLNERLDQKRIRTESGDDNIRGKSGFGPALRLSSEFIAAVLVGVGLGWLFDTLVGTSPWGMVVFLMLGFVAGVLNIMRATGQVKDFGHPIEGERVKGNFTVGHEDEESGSHVDRSGESPSKTDTDDDRGAGARN